jgi:hypothetical protein
MLTFVSMTMWKRPSRHVDHLYQRPCPMTGVGRPQPFAGLPTYDRVGWKAVLRLGASGGGVAVCAERADPTWPAAGSFADARPIVPIDDLW